MILIKNRAVDSGESDKIIRISGSYGFTKSLINALTRIQQRQVDNDQRGIVVSSVNPGYVVTDMTSGQGFLTPQQGLIRLSFFFYIYFIFIIIL
jgi:NAD(P)-dependent dehydrogenase (short-subunit alcohol dehydrogenase family)